METAKREHTDGTQFFNTTCFPSNLYNSDKLEWKSIFISKDEITELVQSAKSEGFNSIFELEEINCS